jgi:hypothetical protein
MSRRVRMCRRRGRRARLAPRTTDRPGIASHARPRTFAEACSVRRSRRTRDDDGSPRDDAAGPGPDRIVNPRSRARPRLRCQRSCEGPGEQSSHGPECAAQDARRPRIRSLRAMGGSRHAGVRARWLWPLRGTEWRWPDVCAFLLAGAQITDWGVQLKRNQTNAIRRMPRNRPISRRSIRFDWIYRNKCAGILRFASPHLVV